MPVARYRAYNPDGQVIASGNAPKSGLIEIKAEDHVAQVVLYTGPVDDEVVAGSVAVNRAGSISVELPVVE